MVVDSVSDVVQLSAEQVRAVPEIGATIDRQFLTGIGTLDERMLILLDIERLMASTEMGLVTAQAA
jgi:purine-binding chemotaxis protein CheW